MLIKHLILILSNLSLVSVPNGLQVVHQVSIQINWELVENGVFLDDLLDLHFSAELSGVFFESQDYLGTAFEVEVVNLCQLVGSVTSGTPKHSLFA